MAYASSTMWNDEPVLTPERKVWRSVLALAFQEAELPLGCDTEDEIFIEQDQARRFLCAETAYEEEELRLVCDHASIPFDRVVTWARKRYARAA